MKEWSSLISSSFPSEVVSATSCEQLTRCRSGRFRPGTTIEPRKHSGFSPSETMLSAPKGSMTVNESPFANAAAKAPISTSPPTTETRWALPCSSPTKASRNTRRLVAVFSVWRRYRSLPKRSWAFFMARSSLAVVPNSFRAIKGSKCWWMPTPGTEQHDLLVLRSLRRAQPVSFLVLEVEGEKAPANGETISGNDQNQHASRLEPAIAVLEKYLFQPAVLGLAGFEVVGWIQIEQRQGLHWAVHIQ